MPVYPSGTNTWIPSWEATGQVIGFVRNPKQFRINDYIAFRPSTKMVGVYLELDSKQFVRVENDDQWAWPDGGERPSGNNNTMGFDYREFSTMRRDFPVTLGNLTIQQTPWQIAAIHAQMVMSQAMTSATRRALTVLENTANWGTSFGTATALGGGLWGAATSTNPYIRKTINAAVRNIILQTNGRVNSDMIRLVIAPDTAKAISETQELIDVLKQSPFAMAQVRGDAPGRNTEFGLPDKLYGVNVVVENATVETARKGATSALGFVKDSNKAVFTSVQDVLPGDSVGDKETTIPNFSTYQTFYFGEQGKTDENSGLLVVETWDDVRNKRQEIHVVQNTAEKMVAPGSGYLVTNVLS